MNTGVIGIGVAYLFSRGPSQPRNQTRSPALQTDSLPDELPGKPL